MNRKRRTPCEWRQVGPSLHLDEHGDPATPPYVRYRLFPKRDAREEFGRTSDVRPDDARPDGGKEKDQMTTTKKRETKKDMSKGTKKAGAKKPGAKKPEATVVHANDDTFRAELRSELPVLADFSASWCGPCLRLGEVLPAIASRFAGRVKVVKIDVDESPRTAARHVDEGVPTLVLFKGGEPVAVECGFGDRRNTEKWLEAALEHAAPRPARRVRRPTCRG
jgi:thioredoxin 1